MEYMELMGEAVCVKGSPGLTRDHAATVLIKYHSVFRMGCDPGTRPRDHYKLMNKVTIYDVLESTAASGPVHRCLSVPNSCCSSL